jgi:hypothetical protein
MFPGLRAHAARIANDHFISLDCAPNQESEEQSRWQLGDFNVGHVNERACGMCLMCTCNRHAKKNMLPLPPKKLCLQYVGWATRCARCRVCQEIGSLTRKDPLNVQDSMQCMLHLIYQKRD